MGLLCFVAISYGHTHVKQTRLQSIGIDACNSLPCFEGIIPGITSWNDVQAKLLGKGAVLYGDQTDRMINVHFGERLRVTVKPDQEGAKVGSIGINFHNYPLTLREVIMQYGSPCGLLPNRWDSSYQVLYPYMFTVITAPSEQSNVNMDSSVQGLTIDVIAKDCNYPGWRGFASIQRYKDDPEYQLYLINGKVK